MKFNSKKNEKVSPYAKITLEKVNAERKTSSDVKCTKTVFENDGRTRGKK